MLTSETQRPKPHPTYGDKWKRGCDNPKPGEVPTSWWGRSTNLLKEGWIVIDEFGIVLAFVPDGTEV